MAHYLFIFILFIYLYSYYLFIYLLPLKYYKKIVNDLKGYIKIIIIYIINEGYYKIYIFFLLKTLFFYITNY